MNVCFVGSVVDGSELRKFPDASVAGNKMQMGFINGLKANGVNVEVVSVIPVAMWRFNKKPIVIKGQRKELRDISFSFVSFLNFFGIKQFLIKKNIKKILRKFCETHIGEENILMVYNTMSFMVAPLFELSKKYNYKTIGIIADLPIQEEKSFIRKIEDKKQIDIIKKFDALVPLTKNIPIDFAPTLPYLVIDAGCNPTDYVLSGNNDVFDYSVKNILYSGSLNSLSGIDLAIDAFSSIKRQDVCLYICGGGINEKLVIERSKLDSRIKYCGHMDYQTIINMQAKADLLICPRKSDSFTTKYTFPSKILEYMCSGTPVLCNKLDGVDKVYEKYINFANSETPEVWANEIENILFKSHESYIEKAKLARDFSLRNKSWVTQCKNLVDFINTL